MDYESTMTLDQAIEQLDLIKNNQGTFKQDEAVKYALSVLQALKGNV